MKPIEIKLEDTIENVVLSECDSVIQRKIGKKLVISTSYYDLPYQDREDLLHSMQTWSTEELEKVRKFKTNNRASTIQ